MADKYILDMTCGGRSIWFNKNHPHTIYFDRRDEEYEGLFGKNNSYQTIKVHPDIMGDYRKLPFENNTFSLVVFDPPHKVTGTHSGWTEKKYGYFESKEEALESVSQGVQEAMRVLKPQGTLIFKWAETSIPTPEIIKAIGIQPLFGHRSGKKSTTNWMCFIKESQIF